MRYGFGMIGACVVFYSLCGLFPEIMALGGVSHEGVWFLDTFAILAALDARGLGWDPYAYNPLNYFGGPHVYSHWWLFLGKLHLGRPDTFWLGCSVVTVAVGSAWIVLRPRNGREMIWALVVLCSAPMVLALNRANVDLVIFAFLSLCVPAVTSRSNFVRMIGLPCLVALGMGLKYYPVAAGVMVLAVRPSKDRRIALLLMTIFVLAVGIDIAPDIAKYTGDRLPLGLHTFGAPPALMALGLTATGSVFVASGWLSVSGWWLIRRPIFRNWKVPAGMESGYLSFILGSAILACSFLLTVNYAYRWIFAIWMMPFLCRTQPFAQEPSFRPLWNWTRWLLVVALWSDTIVALALNLTVKSAAVADRWIGLFKAIQQPFIWGLFVCLSGWLAHFVVTRLKSPAPCRAALD